MKAIVINSRLFFSKGCARDKELVSKVKKRYPNVEFYFLLEHGDIIEDLNGINEDKSEILFIDDNKENIERASKLGIKAVQFGKNDHLYKIVLDNI